MDSSNESEGYSCEPQSVEYRWYMVAVAGTALSIVSLVSNLIIAKVLLSSRHSHFFFLALLALSDCFLSFMYGPVIAMDIIREKAKLLWLTQLYFSYVAELLSLCQVSMTFSSYLIILATIERYLITERSEFLKKFRKCRGLMALFMFILSLLLKGTMYFEIEVQKNGNCTGLNEFVPGLNEIVGTYWYGEVFRFYIRHIMTVFLPFFLLAYLNYRIVGTLRRQQRTAEMFRYISGDQKVCKPSKTKIRSATRLMVIIVCSYLVANILNVLISLWEFIDFNSTQTMVAYVIYEACTDVISVLYVFVCACRLVVYYYFNEEIGDCLREFCSFNYTKKMYSVVARPVASQQASNQMGTELDAVAIAIARRMMAMDLSLSSSHKESSPKDTEDDESPLQAVIYANNFGKDYLVL